MLETDRGLSLGTPQRRKGNWGPADESGESRDKEKGGGPKHRKTDGRWEGRASHSRTDGVEGSSRAPPEEASRGPTHTQTEGRS